MTPNTVLPRNSVLQNCGLPLSSGQYYGDQHFITITCSKFSNILTKSSIIAKSVQEIWVNILQIAKSLSDIIKVLELFSKPWFISLSKILELFSDRWKESNWWNVLYKKHGCNVRNGSQKILKKHGLNIRHGFQKMSQKNKHGRNTRNCFQKCLKKENMVGI